MRILIIEDDKVSQKKMEVIMKNYGECLSTASGLTAWELYQEAYDKQLPFDIIMLDITLHELNGLDLLVKIREHEESQNTPVAKQAKVIMVTSHKDKDHITSCVTAGCNGYLVKPFDRAVISKCLRDVYLKYIALNFPEA